MEQGISSPPLNVPQLRSLHSWHLVQVVFCNQTPRTVQPIWVDFQGEPKLYPILPPWTELRMNTYLDHIWLFRELDTDVPLLVNKKEIYVPSPNVTEQPAVINICLPVFTLKDHCLQLIRSLVKPEDFRKLEIVATLYEDLENRPNVLKDLRRLAVSFWKQTRPETSQALLQNGVQ